MSVRATLAGSVGHSRWYLFRTHRALYVKHWAGVSHSLASRSLHFSELLLSHGC